MMQFESVSKTYRTDLVDTLAVGEATFAVAEGDFLAITGRSGSGKSTLAALAGLLDTPSAGAIRFQGEDVAKASPSRLAEIRRRHIGFVFQSFHLVPQLRVAQNVDLALDGLGLGKAERRDRVEAVLEKLGVASRGQHYPRELSGGQQQRVAIARALVRQPSILICDEPTGNLDTENGEIAVGLLKQAHADGATILMVTHDERMAQAATRRLHMRDGRIEIAQSQEN